MQRSGKLKVKVANQIIKSYDSPARMEGEMCISHLPEEILQYIASFLSPHDVTRLSMTCHQIKKILPVFLHKNGPDITSRSLDILINRYVGVLRICVFISIIDISVIFC